MDSDNPPGDLLFVVTNVQHGYFHAVNQSQALNSFTQQQVSDGLIAFSQDQSNDAPQYFVTVSDGQLVSAPAPLSFILRRQLTHRISSTTVSPLSKAARYC